jgi:hypothetical protein
MVPSANPDFMLNRITFLILIALAILTGCSKDIGETDLSSSDFFTGGSQSGGQYKPGVITAGEWNDLDNWSFWENIILKDEYKSMPAHWAFFNAPRVAVKISAPDQTPVVDALVQLKKDGVTLFSTRTDNQGRAELWADLFRDNQAVDFSNMTIDVNNGAAVLSQVKPFRDGINHIELSSAAVDNQLDICFVVDATASMSDEIEYLKAEILDVISRVRSAKPSASILTSSVFYRDQGDEYLTRVSPFSSNIHMTVDFIKKQKANGGGDFPEAVHAALDKAVNELQWSARARTRLLFLVLDAPPHHDQAVIRNLQQSITKAAEKGIKVIPITASGIDKETEFLMRFLAISTNGTYVFITDHSGIGESHLEASVGQYEVEFLNDLMVRLINKYSE